MPSEAKQSKNISIIEPFKLILKPDDLLNWIIHVLDRQFHLFDFSLEFFMLWFEFLQGLLFPFFFRSKFEFELIVTFLPFKFVLGSLSRWLLLEFCLLVLDLTILLHFHAVNFLLSFDYFFFKLIFLIFKLRLFDFSLFMYCLVVVNPLFLHLDFTLLRINLESLALSLLIGFLAFLRNFFVVGS